MAEGVVGIAAAAFVAGGLLTATQASDKRAAITDLVTLAAPMLAGVLLVQLLNSRARIRLALFLIVAIGRGGAVVCADQYFSSNQTLISDYEANRPSTCSGWHRGGQPGTVDV
jgi:hypothetical protein